MSPMSRWFIVVRRWFWVYNCRWWRLLEVVLWSRRSFLQTVSRTIAICTYLPPNDPDIVYDFTDLTDIIRQDHPSRPSPQPGDFHFLTFLGCEGISRNSVLRKPNDEGPYSVANIGMEIPYCIENPLPGCDDSVLPDIIIEGPDGGAPTYWWCPKCKMAQQYTDKWIIVNGWFKWRIGWRIVMRFEL